MQLVTFKGVSSAGVNDLSLVVKYIIILKLSLTYAEVVLLNFLLGSFQRFGYPRVLNNFTLLKVQLVHDIGNSVGSAE